MTEQDERAFVKAVQALAADEPLDPPDDPCVKFLDTIAQTLIDDADETFASNIRDMKGALLT